MTDDELIKSVKEDLQDAVSVRDSVAFLRVNRYHSVDDLYPHIERLANTVIRACERFLVRAEV